MTMPGKTLKQAQAAQDDGVAASVAASGDEWQEYAVMYVKNYLRTHNLLFCDDVWAEGLEVPVSPRAFGAVMRKAISAGWMRPSGAHRRSKSSNNSMRPVYLSLISTSKSFVITV